MNRWRCPQAESRWCISLRALLLLIASAAVPCNNRAHESEATGAINNKAPALNEQAAFRISQAALGRTVGNHEFHSAAGDAVRLQQFRGKPLVVSFAYTSCHHTCPILTNYLAGVVKTARDALGEESFSVLTVGFDTANDTPQRMQQFAAERNIGVKQWWFVGGDQTNVDALARDLGFIYFPSPKGFDHLAQTTILDAEGKIYRQLYGDAFPPPTMVEPLKELIYGSRMDGSTVSGWINGLRLFCTVYDPTTGRYRFDYSVIVTVVIGVLCLGAVGVFVVRAWRHKPPPSPA